MLPSLKSVRLQAAFSLLEATIAVGIVGFAFVPMLGLMPAGLSAMRDAMDSTTEGMIVQQLAGQARLGSFSSLEATYHGQTFYSDQDGTSLSAAADANSYYRISTSVPVSVYPGAGVSTLSPVSSNLKTLHIEVEVAPGGGRATSRRSTGYNVFIPNQGT